MVLAGGIGATLEAASGVAEHAFWFGEDQGRYVVTAAPLSQASVLERGQAAGVPVRILGTTGGTALTAGGAPPISIAAMRAAHEGWLPQFMEGDG